MRKIIFFFLLFISGINAVNAQGLLNQDLRQIHVDQLSDADILYYYNRLQQAGVSVEQAAQIAAAKGMPQDEILKLQKRIANLSASSKTGIKSSISDSVQSGRTENQSLIQHFFPCI